LNKKLKKAKKKKKKLQNGTFYCVFFVKIAWCFQNRAKMPRGPLLLAKVLTSRG